MFNASNYEKIKHAAFIVLLSGAILSFYDAFVYQGDHTSAFYKSILGSWVDVHIKDSTRVAGTQGTILFLLGLLTALPKRDGMH